MPREKGNGSAFLTSLDLLERLHLVKEYIDMDKPWSIWACSASGLSMLVAAGAGKRSPGGCGGGGQAGEKAPITCREGVESSVHMARLLPVEKAAPFPKTSASMDGMAERCIIELERFSPESNEREGS
jgi:hypothetical protein